MQICSRLIMPCIREAFGQRTACNNQLRVPQYRYYLLLQYLGRKWSGSEKPSFSLFLLSTSVANCSHYLPETLLINLDGAICLAITRRMFLEVLCMVILFSDRNVALQNDCGCRKGLYFFLTPSSSVTRVFFGFFKPSSLSPAPFPQVFVSR